MVRNKLRTLRVVLQIPRHPGSAAGMAGIAQGLIQVAEAVFAV